jgi:hypothetical protein
LNFRQPSEPCVQCTREVEEQKGDKRKAHNGSCKSDSTQHKFINFQIIVVISQYPKRSVLIYDIPSELIFVLFIAANLIR